MNTNKITISIIGFGNVGKCVLYQLLNEFQVDFCINVMEPNEDQYGSFLDISHASFLEKQHELIWNNADLLADSQFIFHCAGANIPLNSDRLSVMEESKVITTAIFKDFKSNVNPMIIVIANPVDIMCYLTYQLTGVAPERIIGTGTLLDSIRMDFCVDREIGGKEPVKTVLLGEHGDNIVLMKSMSLVGDKSLASVLTEEKISDCFQSMKRSASVIKSTQGATYYAVAKCATTILKKVLFPTTETVPVSVLLSAAMQNELDCPPLFMSVPAVLTNKGAFPVSDFTCSPDELAALKVSAQRLAGYCKF